MRPETEAERAARHAATLQRVSRSRWTPPTRPREPFVLEQHFYAAEGGDIDGLTAALEERGFKVESLTYDPEARDRAWRLVAVRLELLEEKRLLAVSDELDALAHAFDVIYDGWLTHVPE